jgi:hypothetical protein
MTSAPLSISVSSSDLSPATRSNFPDDFSSTSKDASPACGVASVKSS